MVDGEVRATERIELGPKARVIGDVQYNLMEISIGAQFDGKLIPKNERGIVQEDTKTEAEQSKTGLVVKL